MRRLLAAPPAFGPWRGLSKPFVCEGRADEQGAGGEDVAWGCAAAAAAVCLRVAGLRWVKEAGREGGRRGERRERSSSFVLVLFCCSMSSAWRRRGQCGAAVTRSVAVPSWKAALALHSALRKRFFTSVNR